MAYLAVKSKGDEHEEKKGGPEGGGGETGHGRGVHHERQTGAWGRGTKIRVTMVCQRQKFLIHFNDKKIKVQIAMKIKRIHCRTRKKKIIIAFKEYNCSLSSIKRVNQS